jgi:glutaredoxin 3
MDIMIYTKSNCPNCLAAKMVLKIQELPFREISVDIEENRALLMKEVAKARQMPQIFINGQRVGGLAGLQAALKQMKGQYD